MGAHQGINKKNKKKEGIKSNQVISFLENIKSHYIIKQILDNLQRKRFLEIFKYNKNIQNKIELDIKDYKKYSEIYSLIEIEASPIEKENIKIINISDKIYSRYYHVYINDSREELKTKTYYKGNIKINKIKIVIENNIISFSKLFEGCELESINFKKFYRNNIIDMSHMFSGCLSLKELNISNIKTDNVTIMAFMFSNCPLLKELNLSNFKTNNVTEMTNMFFGCHSL